MLESVDCRTKSLYLPLLLILLLANLIHSSKFTVFDRNSRLLKMLYYNETIYIGSANSIYQLDRSYNVIDSLATSPDGDTENPVTIMDILPDPSEPFLFWCGSADYGLCHVNRLTNGLQSNRLDVNFVPNTLEQEFDNKQVPTAKRDILGYGVFGHLGSRRRGLSKFIKISDGKTEKYRLLLTSTQDGRREQELPNIGFYSLRLNSRDDYFIIPTVMNPFKPSYSWLAMYEEIAYTHPIYHIKIIEYLDKIYIVTLQQQRVRIADDNVTRYETRIARFDKDDKLFKSYVETPVKCQHELVDFNIAVDAGLRSIDSKLGQKFGVDKGTAAIFLLQGVSTDSSEYTTSSSSAVCMLPMTTLDQHLDAATKDCHEGRGFLVEWYYGHEKPCRRAVISGDSFKLVAEDLLVKAGQLQTSFLHDLPYNVTMMYIDRQGLGQTIALLGTADSRLIKMNLNDGHTSLDYQLTPSGNDIVEKDTVLVDDRLLVIAGNKLVAFPLRSCEIYETASQCIDSRDPLKCGWCGGKTCTTRGQCNSTVWYDMAAPPEIDLVSPINGSTSGGTLLTIVGRHFTNPASSRVSDLAVYLHGICTITSLGPNRIICLTDSSARSQKVKVVVQRKDFIRGKNITTQSHSQNVTFTFKKPSISWLSPSYGPISGGTRITITGSDLHIGNSVDITIGTSKCQLTSPLSPTSITCITPSSNNTYGAAPVSLIVDDIKQDANLRFYYKPDPIVYNHGVTVADALVSGGTYVCVNGINLDSVHTPLAQFTIESGKIPNSEKTLSQACKVTNSSSLCCGIPDLTRHYNFTKSVSIKNLSAKVSLMLDGVAKALPSVKFHPAPTVYGSFIKFQKQHKSILAIKGDGFQFLEENGLAIKVFNKLCCVTSITPHEILCSIEHTTPRKIKGKLKVWLIYGNYKKDAGELSLSHQSPKFDHVKAVEEAVPNTMVFVSAVLALVFGIGIASCICLIFRRSRRKKSRNSNSRRKGIGCLSESHNCDVAMTYNSAYAGSQLPESMPMMSLSCLMNKVERSGAGIDRSLLQIGTEIGSGCFGKVFKGTLQSVHYDEISIIPVAVKTLKGCQISSEQVKTFLDEALLMRSFHHDHVLSLIGISFDSVSQPLVVLPYLSKGDLRTYLKNSKHIFPLKDKLRFAIDIGMGMNYLQDVMCIHRDLAARNCMLDDNLRVKVADFGLSRDLYEFSAVYMSNDRAAKLPVKWMAPESIEHRQYSSKSDMWSYGVTLWEIFTNGAFPYPNVDNNDILRYIKSGGRLKRPDSCPYIIYEWMLKTWQIDPESRPDFGTIVSELQLFSSNLDNQLSVHSHVFRTRSFDSGNHSDEYSSDLVVVEDYLEPIPAPITTTV